jgi:hypothetical protein
VDFEYVLRDMRPPNNRSGLALEVIAATTAPLARSWPTTGSPAPGGGLDTWDHSTPDRRRRQEVQKGKEFAKEEGDDARGKKGKSAKNKGNKGKDGTGKGKDDAKGKGKDDGKGSHGIGMHACGGARLP